MGLKESERLERQREAMLTTGLAPDTIVFRLKDDRYRKQLAARSLKAGLGPHAMAEQLVRAVLNEEEKIDTIHEGVSLLLAEREVVRQGIEVLRQEVDSMRRELAMSVEVLLCEAGKIKDDDAKAWVRKKLKRE